MERSAAIRLEGLVLIKAIPFQQSRQLERKTVGVSNSYACHGCLLHKNSGNWVNHARTHGLSASKVLDYCGLRDIPFRTRPARSIGVKRCSQILLVVARELSAAGERDVKREVRRIMMQVELFKKGRNPALDLRQAAKNVNIHVVQNVFELLVAQSQWRLAMQAFEMLRMMQGYVANNDLYNRIISLLGRVKQPALAADYFKELKLEGLEPTVHNYTAMVDAYGRSGMLKEAMALFKEMMAREGASSKPDVYTYTSLIRAFCNHGEMEKALFLFKEMEFDAVPPNEVTYNTMIEGYSKAGDIERMEAMFLEMAGRRMRPDLYTFHSLIDGYGRKGEIEKMENTFMSMQEQRRAPDVLTYNLLISAYGTWGQYEKMVKVFRNMSLYGCSPSVVTYNILLDMYSKARLLQDVEDILKRMHDDGVRPNKITFAIALEAFASACDYSRMEKTLQRLRGTSLKPTASMYTSIVGAYAQGGYTLKMESVLATMEEEGCRRTARVYQSMAEAYARSGKLDSLDATLEDMRAVGFDPSPSTCNAAVRAYATNGQIKEMENILLEMGERSISAESETLESVIQAYGKAEMFERMEEVLKRPDCSPREGMFRLMIEAYGRSGLADKMEAHLQKIRDTKISTSIETFNALVKSYAQHRRVYQAQHVVREMKSQKISPNGMTFASLALAHSNTDIAHIGERTAASIATVPFANGDVRSLVVLLCMLSACKRWEVGLRVIGWAEDLDDGAYRPICDLLLVSAGPEGVHQPGSIWSSAADLLASLEAKQLPSANLVLHGALLDALCAFGQRATARRIASRAAQARILAAYSLGGGGDTEWAVSLCTLPNNAATAVLLTWLDDARMQIEEGTDPPDSVVITLGRARPHWNLKGVKDSGPRWHGRRQVEHLLDRLSSPFHISNGNPWLLRANGNEFKIWIVSEAVKAALLVVDHPTPGPGVGIQTASLDDVSGSGETGSEGSDEDGREQEGEESEDEDMEGSDSGGNGGLALGGSEQAQGRDGEAWEGLPGLVESLDHAGQVSPEATRPVTSPVAGLGRRPV